MMIAQVVDMDPGTFVHTIGDAHIYSNHVDQVDEQLCRNPLPLPKMNIHYEKGKTINDYKYEDFQLENYHHHPAIKAPIAV